MSRETETKFKITSPTAVRKRLGKIRAKRLSRRYERDIYYAARETTLRGTVIRLRTVGGKDGIFTVKYPSGKASSVFKEREELETRIGDRKVFQNMLRVLGFRPQFRKEKKRETYVWKDAKILIDELPYIGWYVEIEAGRRRIRELAGKLGLDMKAAIPETYMTIFSLYKIRHGCPNVELIFNKGSNNRKPKTGNR